MPKAERTEHCDLCGTTVTGDSVTTLWYTADKLIKIFMCEKCVMRLCEIAERNREKYGEHMPRKTTEGTMIKDGRLICDLCGQPMTVKRYDDHYNIWYRPKGRERSVLIDICAECAEKLYERKKQVEHDKGTND